MKTQSLSCVFGLCVAMSAAGCHQRSPPLGKMEFRDVSGYVRRLNESSTAEAAVIRKQIAAGSTDLAIERAAAQREGIPVFPAQLARPNVPVSTNAAQVYQKLAQRLTSRPIKREAGYLSWPLTAANVYTPKEIEIARRQLADNRDCYNLIDQATDRVVCDFGRNWNQGPAVLFPEYSRMREAARLLRSESFLLAREGSYAKAVSELARGFRLAEHAASDPILIAYLVGIAIDAITLAGMEDILIIAGPNAEVANLVRRTIETHKPHFSLKKALFGEVACFQAVSMDMLRRGRKVQDFESLAAADPFAAAPQTSREFTAAEKRFLADWIDASQARILRDMPRLIKAADEPLQVSGPVFKQVADNTPPSNNPVSILHDLLVPVFSNARSARSRAEAQALAVQAGAAVMAYRAHHGSYPTRLEQAIPQLSPDPFTGKPLKYRREPEGFVVYSPGAEGTYDGGKPGLKRASREVCFRYPPPKPTRPNPPVTATVPRTIRSPVGTNSNEYAAPNR